ncbi:AAA ATPase [Ruminiclostridium papyrosolvens DSM 2782]|uniref:AAA ATPase n=1 Tax=Ruminiclostridium papyrosolvens DSM 2782 TaxID=588581 RepID=F1TFM0_9FIRM|nr:AAA family ATPase [Ruminiclostridium papyrosolvens]EGD46752.1 AAA ATPase [Ruminiclostridium papyrosolvens DSM 2782]WES34907.1 AAA family ATPase [Ruminiclostridium papyrosolvens DSM 2782]
MIKAIKVKKLFGIYNHDITLNNFGNVTILHSPNGSGKTTIFRMLKALNEKDLNIFTIIPFKSFYIELETCKLQIHKLKSGKVKLKAIYSTSTEEFEFPITPHSTSTKFNVDDCMMPTFNEQYLLLDHNYVDRSIATKKRILKYQTHMLLSNIPSNMKRVLDELNIELIDAERLLSTKKDSQNIRKVTSYPNELKEQISKYLSKSGVISQELDATFPSRVITSCNKPSSNTINDDELRKKLTELSFKRNQLKDKGILFEKSSPILDQFETKDFATNEVLKLVLSLYIDDNFEKLKVLEELLNKIILFETLVNKFFLDKEIAVDNENGFKIYFKKGDLVGQEVLPAVLSSGEQHFLVLFFELVFLTPKEYLVLIDEPEISLHIAWQLNMVDNLKKISELNNTSFLLATHSPSIILNHKNSVIATGYEDDVQ